MLIHICFADVWQTVWHILLELYNEIFDQIMYAVHKCIISV